MIQVLRKVKKSVVLLFIILREPRGSQLGQDKWRGESFQTLAEEPLGTDSHRTICKQSSEYWLLTGHNNTMQSANRFSWVRTRWLLSCHSCAVYSPSFPNQTKELPMSRKMFWMLSAWARENSVSDGSQCVVNNRKFKMRQRRTRNQKKT